MKRTPEKNPVRTRRADTNNVRIVKRAARNAAHSSELLLAEMERQRNLLELQNEELRKAQAEIEISHQRFSELHEQAPVGFLTFDAQGCIREINMEALRLLGERRTAVIGKPFLVYVEKPDRRKYLEHLWKIRRAESRIAIELRLNAKDGTALLVRMTTGRHHDAAGRSTLFLSAIEDVTERKLAEEAIRTLNAELDERVAMRTASLLTSTKSLMKTVTDLQQEREERRRLEQEVIRISEIERERIGQDLHDDLGQQLAGLWFFSSSLEKNLRAASSPEADRAKRIAGQLDKALALTRSLARGLQPVMPESGGLMAALRELTTRSAEMYKVRCRLSCRRPVHVHDPTIATHLYRIAQEAVTNAAKHGHAKHITIMLSSTAESLQLTVSDDGIGVTEPASRHSGMGMRTMRYRAEALGGTLVFHKRPSGGTSVICTIPKPDELAKKEH